MTPLEFVRFELGWRMLLLRGQGGRGAGYAPGGTVLLERTATVENFRHGIWFGTTLVF